MIGQIEFPNGLSVVLPDEGEPKCTSPAIGVFVKFAFLRYLKSYSPADGVFGTSFLYELAETLHERYNVGKGKVTIEEKEYEEDADEGEKVY